MEPEPHALTRSAIERWCDRAELEYSSAGNTAPVVIPTPILDGRAPLFVLFRDDQAMVTFALELPFAAPAERHEAVARTLNDINARAYMGAWVLNTDTGKVYFRATVPANAGYSDDALHSVAGAIISTVNETAGGVAAVALDGADPAASASST